ncbi:MAG: biotin-dependent carboxyltransferase family protein [Pseudomonadota bacterium]
MLPCLIVRNPGLHTTIQDLGRTGYLDNGVPPSGAIDFVNLRLANILVGNDQGEGCLEILHGGPEYTLQADSARFALGGTDSFLDILEPDRKQIEPGRSATLARGARFRVVLGRASSCAYLAVAGGYEIEPVMGSVSTYVRGEFGGFKGRPLRKADQVPLRQGKIAGQGDFLFSRSPQSVPGGGVLTIRVIPGPQQDYLTREGTRCLFNETFSYSPNADRMGIRLDGPTLELQSIEGFVSDGIIAGAIQVPGSGQPIVLMADHQTSGGYPKVATVISVDLPLLGRALPGTLIRFKAVTIEEAQKALSDLEADIQAIAESMQPIRSEAHLNSEHLLSNNLISGFVTGGSEDN